jgi:glycine cleavage system regulatory protein
VITLVLAVLGDDRPGLVDTLSGLVTRHGGSWDRSQMARLGGKFAGIVQVVVPAASAADLETALTALRGDGLHVTVERTVGDVAPTGRRVTLSLVGTDQPGLVHAVSAALAAIGASIEELTTAIGDAPMSGGPLFSAEAVVALPATVDVSQLRAQLEHLAGHLMVDIDLRD